MDPQEIKLRHYHGDAYVPSQVEQQQQRQGQDDEPDFGKAESSQQPVPFQENKTVIDQQKRQYLAELRKAIDSKKRREVEQYLDEHGSYIDTATILDHGRVGKPRFIGYNSYHSRMRSDVTHPV